MQSATKSLFLGALLVGISAIAAACGDDAGGDAPTPLPGPATDGGAEGSVSPTLCPNGVGVDWPPGQTGLDVGSTLPKDLAFDGPDGGVRIADYFEPCAPQSRILAIRTSAAWCGTCDWHFKNTQALLDDPRADKRLVVVDLLVADEDNMPPDRAALERLRTRLPPGQKVALDPKLTFAVALISRAPLPIYVFVDTRSMKVLSAFGNPDADALPNRVALELAFTGGKPRPTEPEKTLFDGTFSRDQIDIVRGMRLVATPPPDTTNEVADNPAAALLGQQLFNDTGFSPANTVSCATCHASSRAFTDGAPQSTGVTIGDRNSPSVVLASHARWQFWDGRADTLWAQALGPPENAKEIAGNRLQVAHRIAQVYAASYGQVFPKYPLPAELESNPARFPGSGKPGDAAWEAMQPADKDDVTRIYVNVGKAIAAFERSLRVKPSALDRYIDGDLAALTPPQKTALHHFLTSGCAQCHWGPRLTDDAFHVIRMPTGRQDKQPDRGRIDVLADLAKSEFTAASKWSDDPKAAKPLVFASEPSMLGAFKTPSLRAVAVTAPYGHGGALTTIRDVVDHYGSRGDKVRDAATGIVEPWVVNFDMNVVSQMIPIFEAFDAEVIQ